MTATLSPIGPLELMRRLEQGGAVLIDVREPSEHARERIPGARLVPLSIIDGQNFDSDRDKVAVFHCRTGNRTAANADHLLATGFREMYALTGGLEAWKAAGLPTHVNRRAPIELFRQVQIAAGSLTLLGLALAWVVSPWFAALSAFVGAGLIFAGVTGTCGLARVLSLMPWNRAPRCSSAAKEVDRLVAIDTEKPGVARGSSSAGT
jgi:rhodanese-related sulfurtransferase